MKENKNKVKVITFLVIVVVVLVAIVVAILLNDSSKKELVVPKGNNNVITNLIGTTQSEIDAKIKSDLEEKQYDLNNAKIYLNPYSTSPLSALIVFKTSTETDVKVTVIGKHGDDITTNYGKEIYHYIPVYGLYTDYQNTVTVTLGTNQTKTFTITTNKLDGKPTLSLENSDLKELENDMYFVSSPLLMTSYAFDNYGEIRWLTGENYFHDIELLPNGHMLIGTDDINDDGLGTRIIEIDYLGRIYNEYNIEEGYLNSFYVKADGNIIVASKKEDRDTYSDYIIEISSKDGKIVKSWDVYEKLKSIDPTYTSSIQSKDYFYNSGINYNASRDELLLTYWGGDFVINLGYTSGDIKWIFSNPKNFTPNFESVLLKASSGFTYPKSMHSAFMDGSNLKVFDNGFSSVDGNTKISAQRGAYSSANSYKIENNTIELIKSIDENKSLFSYALADYKKYDDIEFVLFGRELTGNDFSRDGELNDYEPVSSRVLAYKNDKKILDIVLDNGALTLDKVSMNTNIDFTFDTMESYSTVLPSKKEPITTEILKKVDTSTPNSAYKIGYSKNVIECNVLFMSTDEAKLILINQDKEGALYTLKEKGEKKSKKIVTDLPTGKYEVFILENDTMYNIDSYIEIK